MAARRTLGMIRELDVESGKGKKAAAPHHPSRRPTRASAAVLPFRQLTGNSTAAMRQKLESTRAGSAEIEARLRSLTSASKAQKRRGSLSQHQLHWRRQHADLAKDRAEIESASSTWLAATTEKAAAGTEGDTLLSELTAELRALAEEGEGSDAIRREWSVEMRAQLSDMRELCALSVAQPGPARRLLLELRESMTSQAGRLTETAEVLEDTRSQVQGYNKDLFPQWDKQQCSAIQVPG